VLHAGVQDVASSADGCMFDGRRERAPTQDGNPMDHLLYCFGMATSDLVHNPELSCEVWPHEEESRRVRHDGGQRNW
jgi:hypothetical protein